MLIQSSKTKLRVVTFLAVTLLQLARGALAEERPNVLFIVADDLNVALSGMGHPECKTPNLDRFASTAVSFSQAYCQFPLCAPSRASIFSGQYPLVNGVNGNGGNVAPHRVTLPKHFANHGYWTGRVSKIFHMGIPIDIMEGNAGKDHQASWNFTYNVQALEALTPGRASDFLHPEHVSRYSEERNKWLAATKAGKPYKFSSVARAQYASIEVEEKNKHLLADTIAADKAIEVLRGRKEKDQPFFLAVGFVRPHFPFVATDSAMRHYHADSLRLPSIPQGDLDDVPGQAKDSVLHFSRSPQQQMRRAYYGAIGFMDEQVGRLLAELERLRLREKTIVVFVSDHGYLLGEHHMWKKAKLWEEAIHVPLLVSSPGIRGGTTCNHMVELVDLYPTISELAGLPPEPGAQGQSLVPLLRNQELQLPRNDAFIQVAAGYGLRSGKWAYMWYPKSKKKKNAGFMLYDMENDPEQYHNLANNGNYSSVRAELHQRLQQRISVASKLPASQAP